MATTTDTAAAATLGAIPAMAIHLYPTHVRFGNPQSPKDKSPGLALQGNTMKLLLKMLEDKEVPHQIASLFVYTSSHTGTFPIDVHDHRLDPHRVSSTQGFTDVRRIFIKYCSPSFHSSIASVLSTNHREPNERSFLDVESKLLQYGDRDLDLRPSLDVLLERNAQQLNEKKYHFRRVTKRQFDAVSMGDISDEQEGGPDLSDPFFMISKRATKRPKTHSATLSAIEAYRTRQATKIVPRVKCDIRGPHKPMSDKIRAIRTILWQKHDEAGVERQLNIVRTDKDEIQGYLWEGSSEQFAQDRMTPLWLNFPVLAVLKAYLEMQVRLFNSPTYDSRSGTDWRPDDLPASFMGMPAVAPNASTRQSSSPSSRAATPGAPTTTGRIHQRAGSLTHAPTPTPSSPLATRPPLTRFAPPNTSTGTPPPQPSMTAASPAPSASLALPAAANSAASVAVLANAGATMNRQHSRTPQPSMPTPPRVPSNSLTSPPPALTHVGSPVVGVGSLVHPGAAAPTHLAASGAMRSTPSAHSSPITSTLHPNATRASSAASPLPPSQLQMNAAAQPATSPHPQQLHQQPPQLQQQPQQPTQEDLHAAATALAAEMGLNTEQQILAIQNFIALHGLQATRQRLIASRNAATPGARAKRALDSLNEAFFRAAPPQREYLLKADMIIARMDELFGPNWTTNFSALFPEAIRLPPTDERRQAMAELHLLLQNLKERIAQASRAAAPPGSAAAQPMPPNHPSPMVPVIGLPMGGVQQPTAPPPQPRAAAPGPGSQPGAAQVRLTQPPPPAMMVNGVQVQATPAAVAAAAAASAAATASSAAGGAPGMMVQGNVGGGPAAAAMPAALFQNPELAQIIAMVMADPRLLMPDSHLAPFLQTQPALYTILVNMVRRQYGMVPVAAGGGGGGGGQPGGAPMNPQLAPPLPPQPQQQPQQQPHHVPPPQQPLQQPAMATMMQGGSQSHLPPGMAMGSVNPALVQWHAQQQLMMQQQHMQQQQQQQQQQGNDGNGPRP